MADKTAIIKEAQKYLAKGQIDRAISEWEKLIRESPDGNTSNIIGDLYLRKGDKKSAVESFHKAANYFRREGFSLKALALYKKVLNVFPGDADALFALGELSEEKGLSTDATRYYLAAADSLSKEGRKDRLLDIYQKILSLSPANIPLRNKVAEIFIKEGLNADAAKEYFLIAKIYDDKDDIPKSGEYYRKVLEILPRHKEAAMAMSRFYEKSGEMDNALSCLREIAAFSPEDIEVLFRQTELCLLARDERGAKDRLLKITAIEPKHLQAKKLLAEIYLREGSQEKAWKEYLPVIDEIIAGESAEDSIRILESFKGVDPIQTGKRLVSLFRQLRDNDRIFSELVSLGESLKKSEVLDEAYICFREALDIRPNDTRLKAMVDEFNKEPEAPEEAPEVKRPEGTKEAITVRITDGEKTAEEIFMEADIFSRYGLSGEAIKLLEALKVREPQNLDLHLRLKALYGEASDSESAVTECLVLSELYKRQGDAHNSGKMLQDALEINPQDPRLAERGLSKLQIEPTAYESGDVKEFTEGGTEEEIEDYEDEIAEADFYMRQGLTQEAAKILERLRRLFPRNKDVAERLANLGQFAESDEVTVSSIHDLEGSPQDVLAGGLPSVEEPIVEEPAAEEPVSEQMLDLEPAVEGPSADETLVERLSADKPLVEEPEKAEEKAEVGLSAEKVDYEDFAFSDQDLVDAQEMPEPELDNDVLEIFQEFKKGLEKELGDEDSETHYNLGIAYKEMGLIDDAIKEFQTSRGDPKRNMQSSTMLSVCYMEKGLYSLAIDVLNKVIKEVSEKDESYWAIKYDLAEANEKNSNLKEALDLYTQVFGWNAKFRNVSEKMAHVKAQLAKGIDGGKTRAKKDRVSYL